MKPESIPLSKNYIAEKMMLEENERSKNPQEEEQHMKKKLVDYQRNLIYVKIGTTEHPAFELLDDAPAAIAEGSDSVWVKWASNGKKECVFKHQIVREDDGPRARKRKQPDYYHNQHST